MYRLNSPTIEQPMLCMYTSELLTPTSKDVRRGVACGILSSQAEGRRGDSAYKTVAVDTRLFARVCEGGKPASIMTTAAATL